MQEARNREIHQGRSPHRHDEDHWRQHGAAQVYADKCDAHNHKNRRRDLAIAKSSVTPFTSITTCLARSKVH
jgi:hypothetical protein